MDESAKNNNNNTQHYQVSFHNLDKIISNISNTIFTVPCTSNSDNFNTLINKASQDYDEKWNDIYFDFLIDGILLRSSLHEFVETNNIFAENVIRIECILKEPAPVPNFDLNDTDWVSDIKTTKDEIFSVNYGSELSIWNLNGKKLLTKKINTDILKCLDILQIECEKHVVIGGQSQLLTLFKCELTKSEEKICYDLIPICDYRGHERSVECVAAKTDGTRIVSGSFDSCLKVWDVLLDDKTNYNISNNKKSKKQKTDIQTKVPMVTLKSHREPILGVEWNPLNEVQVVTVSWDHTIITWDLELAGSVSTLTSNKAFTGLSINKINNLLITSSTDSNIRLWDFRSKEGSMVKNLFTGHKSLVSSVKWSSDSEYLFVSSSFDKTVKLWDSRSSKAPLYDLIGHKDRVLVVDWSNPKHIISGGADSTIKTYNRLISNE